MTALPAGIAIALLTALQLFAAPRALADAPDPFIPTVAASTSLSAVRQQVLAAYGVPPPAPMHYEGSISDSNGSRASFHETQFGDDFALYESAAGINHAYGSYHGRHWEQNQNGITQAFQLAPSTATLDPRQFWKIALDDETGVYLEGELHAPIAAYVVHQNVDGNDSRFYFDVHSGLLDRVALYYPGGERDYVYSDYRLQDGLEIPFRVAMTQAHSSYTVDDEITRAGVAPQDAESDLVPPRSRALFSLPRKQGVDLPVRFIDHDIVVRVEVGGRGLDFLLDSGTAGIVIDAGVAQQLGLQVSPPTGFGGDPRARERYAVLPSMSIGSLRLSDVRAFVLPFAVQGDQQTKYVGLLGYDFLANAVFKIDYEHQIVEAFASDGFSAPPQVTAITLTMDDRVPIMRAQAGDDWARVIVDTGSDHTVFFSRYLAAHGVKAPDFKKERIEQLYYPLQQGTIDGLVPTVLYQFSFLRLQDYYFRASTVNVSVAVPKFEDPDCDGLIGHELLSYFNVYFDYPDDRMYLEPNGKFKTMESGQPPP